LTAVPQKTVNCLAIRTRAHGVVFPQFGQVRTSPGPESCSLVPKPKRKNTPPP
jgi:hypothetical protein